MQKREQMGDDRANGRQKAMESLKVYTVDPIFRFPSVFQTKN